ncbi:hypothetical protein I3843_03G104100 [Carya illinoinensis]|nr:hypothetical protein I3843_03G104100 [Carya illinoinensis]
MNYDTSKAKVKLRSYCLLQNNHELVSLLNGTDNILSLSHFSHFSILSHSLGPYTPFLCLYLIELGPTLPFSLLFSVSLLVFFPILLFHLSLDLAQEPKSGKDNGSAPRINIECVPTTLGEDLRFFP